MLLGLHIFLGSNSVILAASTSDSTTWLTACKMSFSSQSHFYLMTFGRGDGVISAGQYLSLPQIVSMEPMVTGGDNAKLFLLQNTALVQL